MAEFVRRHPAVQVELLLLDRVVDLVEEGIDAGIRIARLPDSSMMALPVAQMRRVVCASPDRLRRDGAPARPEALAERPCVLFRGLAPGGVWHFQEAGRDLAVPVNGPFTTNQSAAAVEACAAGLGFGLFLAYQVAREVAERRLQVVLRAFEPPPIPVSLVYSEARLLSPRLRAFLDWMKVRLQGRDIGALPEEGPAEPGPRPRD
jgi:DNA-binding transcriptional LysR family regulator